ncbi:MAG TPA: helix-turn-helix domain-containing protein, partial [Burkholderiaceae bacterium]|nr:helix-turn-helix domain-containing protein [Burkholderiaceae bacterium]
IPERRRSAPPSAPANADPAIADLLAQTVARLEALTQELRNANDAHSAEKQELLTALDGLRAPGLMSLGEAARYLHVSPQTLESLADRGSVPCTRLDATGGWLFTKSLLDEWVAARSRGKG